MPTPNYARNHPHAAAPAKLSAALVSDRPAATRASEPQLADNSTSLVCVSPTNNGRTPPVPAVWGTWQMRHKPLGSLRTSVRSNQLTKNQNVAIGILHFKFPIPVRLFA